MDIWFITWTLLQFRARKVLINKRKYHMDIWFITWTLFGQKSCVFDSVGS